MTAVVESLSSKQALKLWSLLRQHLINTARVLEEIIEQRAWEPLGYESFAEAWAAQMGDITLAAEIRPHVVYQMYAEGFTPDYAARNVKGVGPRLAKDIQRQYKNAVPADFVTVRQHARAPRSAPHILHINVGEDTYRAYVAKAAKLGRRAEDIAAEAIADRFAQIG